MKNILYILFMIISISGYGQTTRKRWVLDSISKKTLITYTVFKDTVAKRITIYDADSLLTTLEIEKINKVVVKRRKELQYLITYIGKEYDRIIIVKGFADLDGKDSFNLIWIEKEPLLNVSAH